MTLYSSRKPALLCSILEGKRHTTEWHACCKFRTKIAGFSVSSEFSPPSVSNTRHSVFMSLALEWCHLKKIINVEFLSLQGWTVSIQVFCFTAVRASNFFFKWNLLILATRGGNTRAQLTRGSWKTACADNTLNTLYIYIYYKKKKKTNFACHHFVQLQWKLMRISLLTSLKEESVQKSVWTLVLSI